MDIFVCEYCAEDIVGQAHVIDDGKEWHDLPTFLCTECANDEEALSHFNLVSILI